VERGDEKNLLYGKKGGYGKGKVRSDCSASNCFNDVMGSYGRSI
jgi:hypothetical protein